MRTLALSEAQAGDIIAEPVVNERGMVILPKGAALEPRMIDRLRLNAQMRITTMNAAQERFLHRLGVYISWLESVGTPVSDLLTDEAHAWDEITKRVVDRGETVEHPRTRFATEDGELVLSISITPLRDASGKVVGAI